MILDPDLLEDDERKIEQEVRGLASEPLYSLYSALKEEASGLRPMPIAIHSAAKTITGELAAINGKLSSIEPILTAKSGDSNLLSKCRSRLLHLQGRITRLLPKATKNPNAERTRHDIESGLNNVILLQANPSTISTVAGIEAETSASYEEQAKTLLNLLQGQSKASSSSSIGTMFTSNLNQTNRLDSQDVSGHKPTSRDPTIPPLYPGVEHVGIAQKVMSSQGVQTGVFPPTTQRHASPAFSQSAPQFERQSVGHFPDGLQNRAPQMVGPAQGWTMSKWPLRYSGGSRDLPADEFIFRAETLARLAKLSEEALTLGLHQLLSGAAASWYWVFIRNEPYATWFDVKRALIEAFQSNVSDVAIRRMMMDRLQRPNERFMEFCLALQEMEVRLSVRMVDHELLEVLKRNMLPHLQDRLLFIQIFSVRELQQSVRQVEELLQRQAEVQQIRRYIPPRVQEISALQNVESESYENSSSSSAPHTTILDRNRQSVLPEIPSSTNPFNRQAFDPAQVSRQNNPQDEQHDFVSALEDRNQFAVCWNCDELGHTFMDCLAPRIIFCFGCGAKNCVRPQCPKCSARSLQGNVRRNVRPPGLPPTNQPPPVVPTFRQQNTQFRQ